MAVGASRYAVQFHPSGSVDELTDDCALGNGSDGGEVDELLGAVDVEEKGHAVGLIYGHGSCVLCVGRLEGEGVLGVGGEGAVEGLYVAPCNMQIKLHFGCFGMFGAAKSGHDVEG